MADEFKDIDDLEIDIDENNDLIKDDTPDFGDDKDVKFLKEYI